MYDKQIMAYVMNEINPDILNFAFKDADTPMISAYERIKNDIIEPFVIPMISGFAGIQKIITLNENMLINRADMVMVLDHASGSLYKVPEDILEGRVIISAFFDERSGTGTDYSVGAMRAIGQSNSILNYAMAALAIDNNNYTMPPNIEILNGTHLRLTPALNGVFPIKIILSYDASFSGFPRSAVSCLASYISVVAKRQIVNRLEFSQDRFVMSSGIQSSVLSDRLDQYRNDSSEDLMNEKLNILRTALTMADDDTLQLLILSQA